MKDMKGWRSEIVDLKEDCGFLEKKIEELVARTPLEARLIEEKKIIHVDRAITRIPDFSTKDADGKVLWLARGGFLDDWKTEPDLEKLMIENSWTVSTSSLYRSLERLCKHGLLIKKSGKPVTFKKAGDVEFK